jgi:3-dehydroquinate synthase
MITFNVELGERTYPIYIGADLLTQKALLRQHIAGDSALVVTNDTVAPLYLELLLANLDGLKHASVVLPDGEQHKSLEMLNEIFNKLLQEAFDRNTTLIALGGGVVGDMAGFAAASYQRGANFIQVPTSLLAQVDSSVGGKTGVNHPLGKNMIGAFHQPKCVIADTATLGTLDDRQLVSGIAEIIKYGLIRDVVFFEWLEAKIEGLMERDYQALAYAIERSCINKAEIVAADELERGQRALLNLGHTFGHAIEAATGYGRWTHGEAVAAGMCMAARLSRRLGWLQEAALSRVETLIARAGLPKTPPGGMGSQAFLRYMKLDKKARSGQMPLVLLRSIGDAILSADYPKADLINLIDSYQTHRPA